MNGTAGWRRPAVETALVSVLVLAVTSVPYVYGMLAAGPGRVYTGLMYDVPDHAQYWSWVTASRQGLFFLPAVLLLPYAFGLFGVQISQTVSDFCSLLITVPLTLRVLNNLKKREEERPAAKSEAVSAHVPV